MVTVNSLDGTDIESYAVALYKQWGIGSKATDHGVLILLAVQDRKYRIEVGYGLEPILPDGKVGGFGREAVPCLTAERLQRRGVADDVAGRGCHRAGRRHRIDRRASATPGAAQRPTPDTGLSGKQLLILGIILLIVLLTPLRKFLFWCFCSGAAEAEVRRRRWFRRRGRRLWRIWRRQFGRRRRQRQLVASPLAPDGRWSQALAMEEAGGFAMVAEKQIDEFVSRMKQAAGENLQSVVLYGSAATGEFQADFSNLNLLCILRESSFPSCPPSRRWWNGGIARSIPRRW